MVGQEETGERGLRRIIYEVSCGHTGHTEGGRTPRLVSRSGFRPFISNCGAALSRRASRASWSGRLLDDASDQYRRPASHWPLLLGAVENRPGDDGQEEARGRRSRSGWAEGVRYSRADLPSFLPPSFHSLRPFFAAPFRLSFSHFGCSLHSVSTSSCDFFLLTTTSRRCDSTLNSIPLHCIALCNVCTCD